MKPASGLGKAKSVEQVLAASDEQPPIRRVKMAGAK